MKLLVEWKQEVDGEMEAPHLVSRTVDRFRQHVVWLKLVGYDPTELQARIYAEAGDQLDVCGRIVPNPEISETRLSRAARIKDRTEFGLLVRQSRRMPVGRDLHRVLLALTCAMQADLLRKS